MERITSLDKAKEILGKNFIGIKELKLIEKKLGIFIPSKGFSDIPPICFSENFLEYNKEEYLLILGMPFYKDESSLTLVKMREHFGCNPEISEPCFYNQDWYLNEFFAVKKSFEFKWYFVKKNIFEEHRGKPISEIKELKMIQLPSAVFCAYAFFTYYYYSGKELLWNNDFVWCDDKDSNDDPIYVGRYFDSRGLNKNGFNIHRHLTIKNNYSIVDVNC